MLPTSPRALPRTDAPAPPPSLDLIRQHQREGDPRRALQVALDLASRPDTSPRDRTAAWFAAGMLHREAGHHQLSAEALGRAAVGEGPLVPWATYAYAAESLAVGRPEVAVATCDGYRQRFKDGAHADACLRVLGKALARTGQVARARAVADAYDRLHRQATIGEQVEVEVARAEMSRDRDAASALLRSLAVRHTAPLTGRIAEELLAELHAEGVESAVIPDDPASLAARAQSLRQAGRLDDAWAVYLRYADATGADPAAFAWPTRQWDWLASRYAARADKPDGDDLWRLYRVNERAGRWREAAKWADEGLRRYGRTRAWRGNDEKLALTFLLAHDYRRAEAMFVQRAGRRGWSGRRARFLAGFTALLDGRPQQALAHLDEALDGGRDPDPAASYWRTRALDALGKHATAREERELLRERSAGWYALLAAQLDDGVPEGWLARDGTWPAPPPTPPPDPTPSEVGTVPLATPLIARLVQADPELLLGWPIRQPRPAEPEIRSPLALLDLSAPPPSYVDAPGWSEAGAHDVLRAMVAEHGAAWPELAESLALAEVGLYDLSGPRMAEAFSQIGRARARRSDPRHRAALAVDANATEWRLAFGFCRDHYDAARRWYGWDRTERDPESAAAVRRLAWPLAHDRAVWKHSRAHDVDPYLVLGLMRTESTYNPMAVSRVGARGAMQIMPRTGNLLADLVHDEEFTTGDVEDPVVAAELGITYMGLLMERFGGAWPLAVASYNGGPHNVSAWLGGAGLDMPLDAFVEHIPFPETRRYVEKVAMGYAGYLSLYAPAGSRPVVPPSTPRDDPSIVDF
jgi:soluble lytic murein transglycosylase